ncbi:hypothetical protein CN941_01755 [Bacillus cereus]|nr:hypothetical protein CN930_20820 [Bacillus cereus]PGM44640.1 hypothetical protein CN941_01755 [Bacillus cereus]
MKNIAIKLHASDYPDPIRLEKGDLVSVSEKHKGPKKLDNWVRCSEEKYNRKGWVPEQIISKCTDEIGVIIKRYTAKELQLSSGEILIGLAELNGCIGLKR